MNPSHSRRAFLALGGAAALGAAVAACTPKTATTAAAGSPTPSGSPATTSPRATPTTPSAPSTTATPTTPIRVWFPVNGDGDVRGVGMPIIAYFDRKPTDARAFNKATTVTANGTPIAGNWYFEGSSSAAVEAHWRPQNYWPGHAKIHMNLPVAYVDAGPGLSYGNSLTLDMATGPDFRGTIDANTLVMTVTKDGALFGTYPVSLGASNTPTARGVKVIMEKGLDIRMVGPGYDDPHVKYTQRLTYGGEYLHSAPWNVGNIGHRSTSNGCTNLLPADAAKLFDTFEIGDVFSYPNANGPAMTLGAGYGDWNVPWTQWRTGGLLKSA